MDTRSHKATHFGVWYWRIGTNHEQFFRYPVQVAQERSD